MSQDTPPDVQVAHLHACQFCGSPRVVARLEYEFKILDEPALLAALDIPDFEITSLSAFVCAECVNRMGGLGERLDREGMDVLSAKGVFEPPTAQGPTADQPTASDRFLEAVRFAESGRGIIAGAADLDVLHIADADADAAAVRAIHALEGARELLGHKAPTAGALGILSGRADSGTSREGRAFATFHLDAAERATTGSRGALLMLMADCYDAGRASRGTTQ